MGSGEVIYVTQGGTYKCRWPEWMHGLKFKPCDHCKPIPPATRGHKVDLVIMDEVETWNGH